MKVNGEVEWVKEEKENEGRPKRHKNNSVGSNAARVEHVLVHRMLMMKQFQLFL